MNNYNFFYWGPLLFKTKLQPPDLKKYVELCSKKTNSVNENLVGLIKHEHSVDVQKYGEIIKPYLSIFYEAFKHWYGIPAPAKMQITKAWANFMTAGEFNPPHIHSSCDLSSVLFVKIPKKLKEEHKAFTGIGGGPGAISFSYGEAQTYSISSKSFQPVEGDFFIFPATLTHFVSPFRSKGERISVSANFKLEPNFRLE